MRLLRNESGAIVEGLLMLVFSITMLVMAAKMDVKNVQSSGAAGQKPLTAVKNAADKYDRIAEKIKSEDAALARRYHQKADELRRTANLAKQAKSQIKTETHGTGGDVPVVSWPKSAAEMTWKGKSPEFERSLLDKLKKTNTRIGRSAVFRDIVKARLYAVQRQL